MHLPINKTPLIIKDFSGKLNQGNHPGIDIIPHDSFYKNNMDKRTKSVQNAKRMVTKILAVSNGKIVYAGNTNIGGLCVALDTIINKQRVRFLYCRLGRIYVKKNQTVEAGQLLARLGDFPDNNLHLHFSVIKNPPNKISQCFNSNGLLDPKIFYKNLTQENGHSILLNKNKGAVNV